MPCDEIARLFALAMKETTLLKIALSISIIGLSILFFISSRVEIKEIGDLNSAEINEMVKIKGTVNSIINSNEAMIIGVTQPKNVNAVLFREGNKSVDIKEMDYIEIIGTVQEYNGAKEVIINRLRVIK